MLFKGYVLTKDKKCIEPLKNREYKTFDDVRLYDEYAGVIADDIILIDIDDYEESEILFNIVKNKQLKCKVYQTTRGKHFYFKNIDRITKNAVHQRLALGIQADIKLGTKTSYAVLKFGGKERPLLYDNDLEEVPPILYPVRDCNYNFKNLEDGDGRNQLLYNYILVLQDEDIEKEDIKGIIKTINKYLFTSPLDDKEIEIILRDESFNKVSFFKGSTFLFDKFANYLKNNHHVIKINGQLHIYKDGVYIPNQTAIENKMIEIIPNLSRAKRQEVLAYLDVLIRNNTTVIKPNLIAFKNGVYDIKTDTLTPLSPDYIVTNIIDWEYDENAQSNLADEVLNNLSCNDKEIRVLLEEMIGYCMFRRNELGKAFVLTGSGSNGKSTFLAMIKNLLGEENISNLDLKKVGDRFSTVMLFNKMANIGDDMSNEFVTDVSMFKKIVTGDSIDAEQKGQPKFNFKPYCKLLFSANDLPRMGRGVDTKAILRRLIIVPFNANFNKNNKAFKPFIIDELKSENVMKYLAKLAIGGLKRVLKNKSFTISQKVQDELDEYEERNNPLLAFVKDDELHVQNEPTELIYKQYVEFCIQNGFQSLSKIEFSRQICKLLDLTVKVKRINNTTIRIFTQL